MEIDWLGVVFRWMHILAAATMIGGTVFARRAVLPALETLPGDARRNLHEAIRRGWAGPVMASSGLLLISGLVNLVRTVQADNLPSWYHPLFGIKFLLAMAVFFIASTLVGRSANAERFRANAKFWLSINLVLAVALVCISGLLRAAPRSPKAEPVEASTPATVGALEPASADETQVFCDPRSRWIS